MAKWRMKEAIMLACTYSPDFCSPENRADDFIRLLLPCRRHDLPAASAQKRRLGVVGTLSPVSKLNTVAVGLLLANDGLAKGSEGRFRTFGVWVNPVKFHSQ